VLRRPSPPATLSGGRVVDPEPPRGIARRRSTPERVAALAEAAPGHGDWVAARTELHGIARNEDSLAADVAAELNGRIVEEVRERGAVPAAELARIGSKLLRRTVGPADGLERFAADRIAALVTGGELERRGGEIRIPGAIDEVPSALAAAMDRLEAALTAPAPPPLGEAARVAGCPPDGVRRLEADGRIVRLEEELAWSTAAYADLTRAALELASTAPLTPAALRDATGTSRKYVMAILEDLDRRAVLRRTPSGHVRGPRAALVDPQTPAGR
jgi:selenocysteine-specific elongation factor